ncbi:Quinol monooxygenase YgiN [Parasphingorhabdus marina DSM 22363]|uniref:Quinol monooxygenase YgiN n=1 Tax=Parasphingorhabdus marina DSM 22363 TaxID=1123272 RepID=A0A1N6CMK4_9SPHN|nr:putative quinol monooxygenase [Parasphingorhabdus marina]SIN59679.1 Quinol monooxygenase YgiN [Parasphingorhabdus marina DSM 22363]
MAAVGLIATLTVAEGKNADFEAAFSELMDAVRANEPGNEFYSVFRSKDNPQEYKVLERYVDQAALDAHGQSEHFKASGPKLAPCMAAAPVIERLDGI